MNHNYENLEVYKRSLLLAIEVIKTFAEFKPYRLGEQICSSAFSIPSNISEGAERGSEKTFKQFLEYASGSAAELNTQLTIVKEAGLTKNMDLENLFSELSQIRKMIRGLIKRFS